jgi:LysM repeat protein
MTFNPLRSVQITLRWLACLVVVGAACQRTPVQIGAGSATPASPASASAPAERSAAVQELHGTVEVRSDSDHPWAAAKPGDRLDKLAQVRTGADGQALLQLTEGSKIRLAPSTTFTFKVLNAYLDSLLTALELSQGKVWVLLNGGQLDVQTPLGVAQAQAAYLSAEFNSDQQTLLVTCLQGTCSLGDRFIPGGSKFLQTRTGTTGPEPMALADYGDWGSHVPEATQLAWLATESVVQGSATLPVVATPSPSVTPEPSPRPTAVPGATQPPPSPTAAPVIETSTVAAPTVAAQPSSTPRPFTPIPRAPLIGRHVVANNETLFCIARAYGVLPAAIAQANDMQPPFNVIAGQTLGIPADQWVDIAPGPVCAPQFTSPYPGLPLATPTPAGIGPLTLELTVQCTANCDTLAADYHLHIEPHVTGGAAPYTFHPGIGLDNQFNSQPFGHCSDVHGEVTVTSADGQTAATAWFYHDSACPTATPKP